MASPFCLSFLSPSMFLSLLFPALLLLHLPGTVKGDCWLIEGDKGYVWLAICSQNQPPYETIPQHINSTVSMSMSICKLFLHPRSPFRKPHEVWANISNCSQVSTVKYKFIKIMSNFFPIFVAKKEQQTHWLWNSLFVKVTPRRLLQIKFQFLF